MKASAGVPAVVTPWHARRKPLCGTYGDGVLEVGGAKCGQYWGAPQLPPGVIQVCILVGLPKNSICSPRLDQYHDEISF